MSLIKYEECGNKVSDKAESYPHCGEPCLKRGYLIIQGDAVYCSTVKRSARF